MREASDATRQIERDLEDTRARLDATLDALQQKLSPAQMVDQAMNWFKDGDSSDLGRTIGRSLRDNPIPVALVGIGLGWLLVGGGGRGRREGPAHDPEPGRTRHVGRQAPPRAQERYGSFASAGGMGTTHHQPPPYEAAAYDDLARKADEAGARIQRGVEETEESFKERLHAARGAVVGVTRQVGEALSTYGDRVEHAVGQAADRFREASRSMSEAASRAADRTSDMAGQAYDMAGQAYDQGRAGLRSLYDYGQSAAHSARSGAEQAGESMRDAGSRTASYLKEQPLLLGAIGLAVGVALGALLPASRYEREIAGDLRRSLGNQARDAVSELGQRAARVAETMLDTAQEAAQREGFTRVSPGEAAAAARNEVAGAARGARRVAEDTLRSGEEALADEAGKARREQPNGLGERRPVA